MIPIFLLLCIVCDATIADNIGKFLWLSDVHLDPYYGTSQAVNIFQGGGCDQESALTLKPYGQEGCDSPERLILSAFSAQKQFIPDDDELDFVLVTGDLCRHANDQFENPIRETQAILSNITEMLHSAYPDIPVIPTFGNNDVTPDYFFDLEAPDLMLEMLTNGFSELLLDDEVATFSKGGYLARNVTETITVISLNTVVYCTHHVPAQEYIRDPLGQFDWLLKQLEIAQSAGRVAYIVGHIAPAVGSYRHSQLWHDHYLERYFSILKDFRDIVVGQLFGHLHSEEFRLLEHPSEVTIKYPLFMASSTTPIYGSNPSFRVVTYNEDSGLLVDYDTYYLGLDSESPTWNQSQSFRESFQVPDMSSSSLDAIIKNMASNNGNVTLWNMFLSRKTSHRANQETCDEECHQDWICTFQSMTQRDYYKCLGKKPTLLQNMARPRLAVVLLGLSSVAFGALVWIATKRYLKRRHYHSHLQESDNYHQDRATETQHEIETTPQPPEIT